MSWREKLRICSFRTQKTILFVFILFAAFGVNNNGGDLMWFPTVLFVEGKDVYMHYILNHTDWFMTSVPNYPPLFYEILFPFSFFSFTAFKFIWYIIVVSILLFSVYSFINTLKSKQEAWIFTCLILVNVFLISSLRVGQITPLIFSAGLLMIISKSRLLYLLPWSLKFTFGLPLFLILVNRIKQWKLLFLIGLIHLVSLLVYSFHADVNLLSALGFLKVAEFSKFTLGTASGKYDLMSLLINNNFLNIFFYYKIVILFFVFGIGFLIKSKQISKQICIAILISLIFFFHLSYDYSLLMLVVLVRLPKINWIFIYHLIIFIIFIIFEILVKFQIIIPEKLNVILTTLLILSLIIELRNEK